MEYKQKMVVAVDFGVTSTVVAFRHPSDTGVRFVDQWPGHTSQPHVCSHLVPSRIAYPEYNWPSRTTSWGFQVEPGQVAVSCMKLLVEEIIRDDVIRTQPDWAESMGIFYQPGGRSHIQMIGDFLGLVREHSERYIWDYCRDKGLEKLPFYCVFTLPSAWSNGAQSSTWKAFGLAGFRDENQNNLLVLPESEAVLTGILADPDSRVEAGEAVAICDLGGGTLDTSTYVVNRKDPAVFKRVSHHTELFGVDSKPGETSDELSSDELIEGFQDMELEDNSCTHLETDKRWLAKAHMYSKHKVSFNVELSGSGMLELQYPLTGDARSILDEYADFLGWRVNSCSIKHIFISGPSTHSAYVADRVKRHIDPSAIVTIHQQQAPETMVAEGAVLWAFDNLRLVRNSYYHYGIANETLGPDDMAITDDLGNGPDVLWFLGKGDQYRMRTKWNGFLYHKLETDQVSKNINIYDSENDVAPGRADLDGVRCVGQLCCNFTHILKSGLVRPGDVVQLSIEILYTPTHMFIRAFALRSIVGDAMVEVFFRS
ncbi:hypothetical protein BO78DRAFT_415487 [Aspergillus sclerotiicarbonarius CBS 121057]|uniref:Actin-like ATPase domain-containing protein n=1 Tax=Aspergillus sclerotiicarbonarius (strain CBS 121057 / IBT 28362) TaxID=1448318 RepID=A0A319EIS8_ASPSB|nr:hypothetical protein BO78DRAFT_415487 [Aspergillus sclerotiicarbonarius CBS 121057]